MRRMYSESQIHKIAAEEAGKLDKVIPTDIGAKSDGALILLHNGKEIDSSPLPMKQMFGKHTLTGEGNIDLYYHSISITLDSFIWSGSIISSSNLPIDSIQDLIVMCANRIVSGWGYYDSTDGAYAVGCLNVGKDITNTYFDRAPHATLRFSAVSEATIEDRITTI